MDSDDTWGQELWLAHLWTSLWKRCAKKKDSWGWNLHFLGQPVPEHPYQDTDSYPSNCLWLWARETPNYRLNSSKMGKKSEKTSGHKVAWRKAKEVQATWILQNSLGEKAQIYKIFLEVYVYREVFLFPLTSVTSPFTAWSWWCRGRWHQRILQAVTMPV